ncbi:MAG: hypothetical protein LBT53_01000 [Puniceicoccales bacterium]|jgi:hypothetical protein|nr:hypothetical protein [Puniceicoccales bacterium]
MIFRTALFAALFAVAAALLLWLTLGLADSTANAEYLAARSTFEKTSEPEDALAPAPAAAAPESAARAAFHRAADNSNAAASRYFWARIIGIPLAALVGAGAGIAAARRRRRRKKQSAESAEGTERAEGAGKKSGGTDVKLGSPH